MHDQDSQFLVAAAQDGDKPAVEALLDRHLPGLRAFVRAKSGPTIRAKESCSDLVQTVCLEVLHGIDTYEWRGEGSFRHWLFTLAIHKIHNRADHWGAARRDAKREVLASATHGALANAYASVFGPSAHAMANETMARLESSLDTLPEDSREVVVLSRIVGLSHQEIADKLSISTGAVRVRLSRALARLASEMAILPGSN